jgi:hypothetical protein
MLDEGTILQNRYRVVRLLGRGGMGAVYEAVDERFNDRVALKQAAIVAPEMGRAFEREARLLRTLRHRSLPVVSDYFHEDDAWYLVMDYVEGEDLSRRLKLAGGALPVDEVLSWGDQLLEVLEYLHGHEPPIVHRDIKPQNLKLTPAGRVVLLDFGLSKGAAGPDGTRGSGEKSIVGYTPHYAPLEQIHGVGTDPRSDLYALAATMYALMTGKKPPDAGLRATTTAAGGKDPLVPADVANPLVPPAVARVLNAALSSNPNARPQTATAMRAALRDAAREPGGLSRAVPIPPREADDDAETRVRPHRIEIDASPTVRVTRPAPAPRRFGFVAAVVGTLATGVLALVLGYVMTGGLREAPAPAPGPAEPPPVVNSNVAPAPEPEPPPVVEEPPVAAGDEPPLTYQDVRVGRGPQPRAGDRVMIHYVGRLQDGTVFDDSYDRDEPLTFTVGAGEILPAWEEAMASMRVGGRRRITIPASRGFGYRDEVAGVPPGSTLVFDVEMVGLEQLADGRR